MNPIMAQQVLGACVYQDIIDDPSHKLPVSVLRWFVSPPPGVFKPPCKFASK